MLQEFDISITAVGDDRYLVRTEQVAPGVPLAQEQFHWPVDDWLVAASNLMHDPLLGILQGESSQRWANRPTYRSGSGGDGDSTEQTSTFIGLGQLLYNSLFDGNLRDSWLTAQGVAQNRRSPLRLRLGLKGEKLQKLPWEVLHSGDRLLGTGTDVTFSRYQLERRQGHDRGGATVPDFETPLRVLMVIATPNDQDRLELSREVNQLKQELHPVAMRSGGNQSFVPQQPLDVQLTVLEQPGRAELTQALEQGHYQALHYAGHSNLGNAGGDLYLVSRQTGLTERISGEDLAGLLSNNGVKLAVFNSCRGAYAQSGHSDAGWHEQNLAQALVNRGIPGVIAMAERIPDDVAINFTQLLYRNLKQGNPIDLCLNRTRQGLISAHGSHYSYWALPILYMQPGFDGYLASKPGDNNAALDQLLLESEADLAALNQSGIVSEGPPEELSPEDVNLDNVVETVGLDDILPYNEDDAETVKELVNQLSKPSTPPAAIPASEDEPLIPDTLETPGLDLYEQLPKKTVKPSVDEVDTPQPTIYGDTQPEAVPVSAEAVKQRPGLRKQHLAMGLGTAAVVGLIGLSISDPLTWFDNPPSQSSNTTEVDPAVPPAQGLRSDRPTVVVNTLSQLVATQDAQTVLDELIDANVGKTLDEPTKLFASGQLQWVAMDDERRSGALEPLFEPSDAMRSWQEALELKSDWLTVQIALGFTHYDQGDLDEAIEIWEKALNNERPDDDMPIVRFRSAEVMGNVANTPTKLHAHMGLAMAYHQRSVQEAEFPDQAKVSQSEARNAWLNANDMARDKGITTIEVIERHWLWSQKASTNWVDFSDAISNYSEPNT